MRALVLTYFVLSVLGVAARLVLLGKDEYPRARPSVDAMTDVMAVVVGLAFTLWAACVLWIRP